MAQGGEGESYRPDGFLKFIEMVEGLGRGGLDEVQVLQDCASLVSCQLVAGDGGNLEVVGGIE
jgi:hypothetical protein